MAFSVYSLIGGLAMLIVGIVDLGVMRAAIYPGLRQRHEEAKVTGRQGIEPNVVMAVFKAVNLVALPALGLLFGDAVLRPLLSS
jgi:hypothetical protein